MAEERKCKNCAFFRKFNKQRGDYDNGQCQWDTPKSITMPAAEAKEEGARFPEAIWPKVVEFNKCHNHMFEDEYNAARA